MPELNEIVPRPTPVAKGRRCAEGPCVKTMLSGDELPTRFESGVIRPCKIATVVEEFYD